MANSFSFFAAIVVAIIFGLLVGLPALRIRGVQLAVVTIAAVIAVENLLLRKTPTYG
ncbi:MAG: hypothetical protein Ct9H90mP5_10900 [Acidimicrobiaceae bacterium]|nr:MAG: hypothetical protein Ct9H90mP5_10900 [Acidimicrobiaceae bacterium]